MADYYKTRRQASSFIEQTVKKSPTGINLLSLALSVQNHYGLSKKFVLETVNLLEADGRLVIDGNGDNPLIIAR